jgi:hypothetical protein
LQVAESLTLALGGCGTGFSWVFCLHVYPPTKNHHVQSGNLTEIILIVTLTVFFWDVDFGEQPVWIARKREFFEPP